MSELWAVEKYFLKLWIILEDIGGFNAENVITLYTLPHLNYAVCIYSCVVPLKKVNIFGMKLNYVCWWGSSSEEITNICYKQIIFTKYQAFKNH